MYTVSCTCPSPGPGCLGEAEGPGQENELWCFSAGGTSGLMGELPAAAEKDVLTEPSGLRRPPRKGGGWK